MEKRKIKSRRNKINGKVSYIIICIIKMLIIMLLIFLLGFSSTQFLTRRRIDGNILKRNLAFSGEEFEEPLNLNISWDSQLPKFILKDLEFVRQHPGIESIEYKYLDVTFTITWNVEGKTQIEIYGENLYLADSNDSFSWYPLTNFSFYQNKEGIIVYGYSNSKFHRFEIFLDDAKMLVDYDEMTQNPEIPFNESGNVCKILQSVDDYALCMNPKSEIYVYHNGKIVTQNYKIDYIEELYSNGMYLTEYNELYMPYIVREGESTKIRIEKVGNILSDISEEITISDENWLKSLRIPIFENNEEFYVVVPKCWETFSYYVMDSGEKPQKVDFGMEMIPIKETFKFAKFTNPSREEWEAKICFDLNGKTGQCFYQVNGYDSRINLSIKEEEVVNGKRVITIDEFWQTIEEIRNLYKKHYDYPKQ